MSKQVKKFLLCLAVLIQLILPSVNPVSATPGLRPIVSALKRLGVDSLKSRRNIIMGLEPLRIGGAKFHFSSVSGKRGALVTRAGKANFTVEIGREVLDQVGVARHEILGHYFASRGRPHWNYVNEINQKLREIRSGTPRPGSIMFEEQWRLSYGSAKWVAARVIDEARAQMVHSSGGDWSQVLLRKAFIGARSGSSLQARRQAVFQMQNELNELGYNFEGKVLREDVRNEAMEWLKVYGDIRH